MIGEHLEPTAPAERSGTGAPKASSVPHEPSDPEFSPSSGKKGPQSPEDLVPLGMMTGAGFPMCCAQSTLCDPVDCSWPGSSVHGISQTRLEWVAISYSQPSSQPRDQTCVSVFPALADSLPLHHLGRCTSLLLPLLYPFHWTLGSTLRASVL